ncbi:MAG: hypothetical protein ACRDRX_15415 [Pseudonocardiaceae bacterium]
MSFSLIVLVAFVLVILGVHFWCGLSELQDQAQPTKQGRRVISHDLH